VSESIGRWLQTFAERSSDGFLLVASSGKIEYSNAAARGILAADAHTIANLPVSHWIPDLELRVDHPVSEVETRAVSATEDSLPIEIGITPIEEEDHFWVVFRDISRRKGRESSVVRHIAELEEIAKARTKELDEARKRHRTMYELAPVLDFDLDSQGSIASANRKASLSLGVPIDRLVGLALSDFAVPDQRDALIASLSKVRDGSTAPFDTQLRRGDGSAIDVTFHSCRGEARSCVRLVGLDVTARHEAERLVDQSLDLAEAQRARMERILRGIAEGVVVTDPDGQVRLMNSAAERFLDIEESYAFGRDLFSEQIDTEFAEAWQSFTAGEGDVLSRELTRGGESARSLAVTISRIQTPEGRPAGCVAVLRDVSRQSRFERVRQDFVANVTHELRTPLASIRDFTATIRRRGDGDPEDTVIEDLFVLSSLETGRESLHLRAGDFFDLLAETKESFATEAAEKDIALEVHTEGQDGRGIFDREKMRRVLDNLISSALKSTPPGGRIEVEVRRERNWLACSVRDSGKGMPVDVLEQFLERHPTANPITGHGGSGLGLHIARRLVELHGGEITGESRPGAGTVLRFQVLAVPAVQETEAKTKPALADDPLIDDPDPVPPSGLSRRADSP
jgi:PAS domain S-box-containing protein